MIIFRRNPLLCCAGNPADAGSGFDGFGYQDGFGSGSGGGDGGVFGRQKSMRDALDEINAVDKANNASGQGDVEISMRTALDEINKVDKASMARVKANMARIAATTAIKPKDLFTTLFETLRNPLAIPGTVSKIVSSKLAAKTQVTKDIVKEFKETFPDIEITDKELTAAYDIMDNAGYSSPESSDGDGDADADADADPDADTDAGAGAGDSTADHPIEDPDLWNHFLAKSVGLQRSIKENSDFKSLEAQRYNNAVKAANKADTSVLDQLRNDLVAKEGTFAPTQTRWGSYVPGSSYTEGRSLKNLSEAAKNNALNTADTKYSTVNDRLPARNNLEYLSVLESIAAKDRGFRIADRKTDVTEALGKLNVDASNYRTNANNEVGTLDYLAGVGNAVTGIADLGQTFGWWN